MPRSIQFTQEVGTVAQFSKAVASAPNLAELLELVPAPYRSPMQDLVNKVYRAAIKANHTRSYLANLEKHEQESSFPPEIGARISAPALQISKEYSAAAGYRAIQGQIDNATLAHKQQMLAVSISLKKEELSHLQSLFAEDSYKEDARNILQEVVATLVEDAGLKVKNEDGSLAETTWPSWIREDFGKMKQHYQLFPARAVALAFAQVSQEMSKKMRGLSLKKRADEDVEMMDDTSRSDNVDALVQRKFEQLLKEYNIPNVGKGKGKKRTKPSPPKSPNQKALPYKVGKAKGKRGNSPGGKGKGKRQTKK